MTATLRHALHVIVVLCAAAVSLASSAAAEPSSASGDRTSLILSHLPLKTSRAYHALRRAARDATVEILPMTKAEIWSVDREHVDRLRVLAKKSGVTLEEANDPAMNALLPMAPGQAMTPKQSEMMQSAMRDKSTMGFNMMSLPGPGMLEYALTRGMNAPQKEAPAITLKLSETVSLTVRRTDIVQTDDSYVWQGEVEGTGAPVTLVFWPQGRISGTIQHAGSIYKVQSLGGGVHGVIETAPKMLPPEHAPMSDGMMQKFNMKEDPLLKRGDASELMRSMSTGGESIDNLKDVVPAAGLSSKPAPFSLGHRGDTPAGPSGPELTITIIVAYTKAAAGHYADIAKDLIALAVAQANQSFRKSRIDNLRVKLVHAYQTGYVEKGTHFEHMYNFAEKADGIADEIHGLRDKYHADIAVMIVDDANGCGLAAGVAPPADRAFAAVHHGCAAATYSLAHEIGHIIGARHDAGYDDNSTPFAFGHGYVKGTKWRTMMSYEQSCGGCPRLPIWSSPDILVQGDPAGSALANNARAIREGARRVAAFR